MRKTVGICISMLFLICSVASAEEYATGIVFDDSNHNLVYDEGEKGLPDVRVSNGREIVMTDQDGRYQIAVDNDTIIFIIKPRGWMTPLNEDNLPLFYYIHKPDGSPELKYGGVAPTGDLPESINFPLYKNKELDQFKMLLFGDIQVASQADVEYLAQDFVEELVGTDAAFGINLGDLVSNQLWLYDSLNKTTALIGIPWYSIIGNHDINFDGQSDKYSDETFERMFGPSYYSFDYGPVHFIALDNIIWNFEKGNYSRGLSEKQLEFVKNDLALVPNDQLVVLTMHSPFIRMGGLQELFDMLAEKNYTFSASAHYHSQEHVFYSSEHGWKGREPHHHLISVTACGSFWKGAPDEFGLPHATMSDGAPNGYSIVTFNGNRYSIEYKAARRPADFQMSIFAPQKVALNEAGDFQVLANIFAGSERSKVKMRVGKDNPWIIMEKTEDEVDAYYKMQKEAEESENPPRGRKLPDISECQHMWKASLPDYVQKGKHLIHVRTTDMFGHTYDGYRVIWIR